MKLTRYCLPLFLALTSTYTAARSNPVPLLYQLTPPSGAPGHAQFNLRIHGTGFVPGAVAQWNGTPLTTQFVSQSIVSATVPASDLAKAGTATVTVANPGGIASNVVYFPIRHSSSTIALAADSASIEYGGPAVGDFNNDSIPDISVYGQSSTGNLYLYTYFGNGHGDFKKVPGLLFRQETTLLCGPNIAADFNNDGNLDVAVCNFDGDGNDPAIYGIFLGDGKGGFTAPARSGSLQGVGAVADMNHDGILDFVTIAASGGGPPNLTVFLGNGDGTFIDGGPDVDANAGGVPIVGDFNGDGNLDIAIPSVSYVAVFLSNGDGTFGPEVDYPTSGGSSYGGSAAVAVDVNGDGKLDIVTNGVSVLLGNGDGTFVQTFAVPVDSRSTGELRVGDFNGDGKLDLATPAINFNTGETTVDVLLGNGDGTFQTPLLFNVSNQIGGYAPMGMADFNNDGGLDFVVGGAASGTIVMLQAPTK
jgi:hypothetical protein